MTEQDGRGSVSRRSVLKASGGALGGGVLGTGIAGAHGGSNTNSTHRCPDATREPRMVHYESSSAGSCADDHEKTKQLERGVKEALDGRYSTVGALIEEGYLPYFDFAPAADSERGGVSHWVNPEYVNDDSVVDPERPESILVDHKWWRPIGVMFIATDRGERIDPPPPVYGSEDEDDADPCLPWHTHVGLPGRYSWWKYRLFYENGSDGNIGRLPCDTPWMMHIWAYPHPESVYAHSAPPRGNRGGAPAEEAGFETDAVPGEDKLDWSVLPEAIVHRVTSRE